MTTEVEWRPGVRTRMHASAATGAEGLCVFEQWCEPGAGAPLHTHAGVEEVIVVLEGEAELTVDGALSRVAAGGSIVLPGGCWHGFVNVSEGPLHTVAVFASAAPPVEYAEEPGVVLEVGGTRGARRDAHRAVRPE